MIRESEIVKKFKNLDTSEFTDFYQYKKPLDMGLWVLWVAKEKLKVMMLTSEQIASIIVSVKEVSINAKSITNSLNRAGDKIHRHSKDSQIYFEIMKSGKDYLVSQAQQGFIKIFYFEPDRQFTSKKILSKNVLANLKGELKIVDPYCGERTLDIIRNVKNQKIRFMTRIDNIKPNRRSGFLRELQDFKHENPNTEFRSYPNKDIHDRYIISSTSLVILGHSIKDLGNKESFAIVLDKNTSKNIFESLTENFNRRWKQSEII